MTTTTPSSGSTVETSGISQYDLILAAVPMPLLAGMWVAATTGLPTVGGLGIGSIASGLFVCYGLFVATP